MYEGNAVQPEEQFNDVYPPSNTAGGMQAQMDAPEFLKELLSSKHLPPEVKARLWILGSNTLKLTFLDDASVQDLKLTWENIRLTIVESLPASEYNEETEIMLECAGIEFLAILNKAKGNAWGNERSMIAGQVSAAFSSGGQPGDSSQKTGILNRLTNLLKGT